MMKYFKDLLATLKSIESSLKVIASCVTENPQGHGDRVSLSTKHWND